MTQFITSIKNSENSQCELHQSKIGYDFDFYLNKWQLDGSKQINFELLEEFNVDNTILNGFKKTLCRYAEEMSSSLTSNIFYYFKQYLSCTSSSFVDIESISKWRTHLSHDTEYKLGALKGFFISWYEYGYPGINKKTIDFLNEITLKGNIKGKAVKISCPYTGPLTDNELAALIEWASTSFSNNNIDLFSYAYFMLLLLTGRRDVNIRMLRINDLIFEKSTSGLTYKINFPRAKQRNSSYRSQFSPLTIDEDLYLILSSQIENTIKTIEKSIAQEFPRELYHNLPIFIEGSRIKNLTSIEYFISQTNKTPDFFHIKINSSSKILHDLAKKNTAMSERTGDFIHLTSRRFRYTKGTNLFRRGIKGTALAAALDHSDTQNISVYTQNSAEITEQINNLMSPVLAPLAQAFAGTLVISEREALRGNDPHSRIKNNSNINIGSCGTHAFCTSSYRACYTCTNFQPWLDAPHEVVLNEIFQERERQKQAGVSPYVIQSTDRLLLAVQQVVIMCSELK